MRLSLLTGLLKSSANVIAESLFAQVDSEGHQHVFLDEILDHRTNGNAVSLDDAFITTSSGRKSRRMTTKGWELLVSWKDGTTSWESLSELKQSHPIEVAECIMANKISAQPAFAWWVPHTLKKRDRIIKTVRNRYWKRTHKC